MEMKVKINKTEKEMSPLIFGHFVEFMRDCIHGGMWAQILENRGFDRKKEIPEGVIDGNPNVADGWIRTGYKNTFEIELDEKESLAKDGLAQKITCYNDYDGFVGVAQENLHFNTSGYKGYVWLKASEGAKVLLRIWDGESLVMEKEVQVKKEWEKAEFEFYPETDTKNGVFEIALYGENTLFIDSASIMSARHEDGIWPEVMEHIRKLSPPVIRYPGGCFADCYHFEDGIGPVDERPYRPNRHWGGYDDNGFGTDEFITFCENVGCEPMICVNFGSGTPEEAANWVEYCNGSTDTVYGKLRALHGHEEPFHVKYWDIGNEIFGDWEIGHSSAGEFADKYLKFYEAMRQKDDSIVFMVCGGDGDCRSQEWNQTIAETIGNRMDVVCLHMYALKSMEGRKHSNEDIYYAAVGAVKKYEEILNESYKTVNEDSEKEILMAVTEYNEASIVDSYREQTLEAAIFNAGMLNMFIRNCEKLLLCNYSDLVNGWPGGCIVSKDGKAFGTASYYVLKLYAEAGLSKVYDVETDSFTYGTSETIGNIEPLQEVPYVDVAAGVNREGEMVIFAVNRYLEEEVRMDLFTGETEIEITELTAEKTSDMNLSNDMRVLPQVKSEIVKDGIVKLNPHSVNRIIVKQTGEIS